MENLEIAKIRRDGGTQPRAALDEATIAEYAEAIQAGAEFPAVDVFFDGERYWLADGFHRVAAHERAGKHFVLATLRQGDRRAAVLFSTGVNAEHGLRRNNADKRRAVDVLLRDPEWGKWANREIARQCKVGEALVRTMRDELPSAFKTQIDTGRTVQRAGTTYTMNTGKIGTSDPNAFATPAQLQDAVRSWLGQFGATVRVHILKQIALQNDVGRDRLVLLSEYARSMDLRGLMGDLKKACAVVLAEIEAAPVKAEGRAPTAEGQGGRGAEETQAEAEVEVEDEEPEQPEQPRGRAEGAGRQTRCMICNRVLDDPESVAKGYGPECADKVRSAVGHGQAGLCVGTNAECRMQNDAQDTVLPSAFRLLPLVEEWLAALIDNAELADDADGKRTALYAVLHHRQNGGARLWASLRKFAGNGTVVDVATQRELLAAVGRLLGEEEPGTNAEGRTLNDERGNGGGTDAGGKHHGLPVRTAAAVRPALPDKAEITESARLLGVIRRAAVLQAELRDGLVALAAQAVADDESHEAGGLAALLAQAQAVLALLEAV